MKIAVVNFVVDRDPDGIGADAQVGSVTKAEHPAVTENQIEANSSDRKNDATRCQVDKKGIAGKIY